MMLLATHSIRSLAGVLILLSTGGRASADACTVAAPLATVGSGRSHGEFVRVIVRSMEQITVSAELNARITQMPQREGDRFQSGDVLIAFDCSRMAAERDASVATFKSARAANQALRALDRYKAASALDLEKSGYDMEKAEADVRAMDARLASCSIRAPFTGRIVEKTANVNELAQPNQPLARLINEERIEVVLTVPSSIVTRVREGMKFRVCVDETGDMHEAIVRQSTGLIDPVSQTVRMIGEFVDHPQRVLPGMSGSAALDVKEQP